MKNQRLKHILIIPTFWCAFTCFFVILLLLALFGTICIVQASSNTDFKYRYDDKW